MDVGYVDTQGVPIRKRIEIDSENLENTFSQFGYQVLHFQNLRATQMVEFLSPKQLARYSYVSSLNEFIHQCDHLHLESFTIIITQQCQWLYH